MDLSLKKLPCDYFHLVLCSYKPEIDCTNFGLTKQKKIIFLKIYLENFNH